LKDKNCPAFGTCRNDRNIKKFARALTAFSSFLNTENNTRFAVVSNSSKISSKTLKYPRELASEIASAYGNKNV